VCEVTYGINHVKDNIQTTVIIGSTGMIGSTVTKFFSQKSLKVIEVNRRGTSSFAENKSIKFDIETDNLNNLMADLPKSSTVLNLAGLIRHRIDSSSKDDEKKARTINSDFPIKLVEATSKYGIRVIQIATDCVFSGNLGGYKEHSPFDPEDVYGISKAKGEIKASNLLNLRVSVIGQEIEGNLELMSWILAMPAKSKVSGFVNHRWNGVTALQVGEILEGIIREHSEMFGTYHVVPSRPISKFDLLLDICDIFQKKDIEIIPLEAPKSVDRTLATNYPEINRKLWKNAGYTDPPDIHSMLMKYKNWIESTRIGIPSGKD